MLIAPVTLKRDVLNGRHEIQTNYIYKEECIKSVADGERTTSHLTSRCHHRRESKERGKVRREKERDIGLLPTQHRIL